MLRIGRPVALACLLTLLAACAPQGAKSSLPPEPPRPPAESKTDPAGEPASSAGGGKEPAVPAKSDANDEALTPLGFRPDLFLLVGAYRKYAPAAQVFGYDTRTGQLGQLTAGGPGNASPIIPSPDGDFFAYFRQRNALEGAAVGICIRPTTGGVPVCRWGAVGNEAVWRPGTRDLYVSGMRIEPYVLKAGGAELIPPTVPHSFAYPTFSPDGRWVVYADDDLWVAPVDEPAKKQKLSVEATHLTWINNDNVVVVVWPNYNDPNRDGKLYLAGIDGKVTPLPSPFHGYSVISITPDPKGRYLAANYGTPASTFVHEGAALYDLKQGTWKALSTTERSEHAVTWVASGKFLLIRGKKDNYLLHDPESGQRKALPPETQGIDVEGKSADGDWIAFLDPKNHQLRLYRISTGEIRQIDTGGEDVISIEWVPAPK